MSSISPPTTEWYMTSIPINGPTDDNDDTSRDRFVWSNLTSWLLGGGTFSSPPPPMYVGPSSSIISDSTMQSLNIYVNILICGGLAAFGAVNNVINMIIFRCMGLRDSMSVGLMFLSFTDFLHSLLVLVSRAFSIWDTFFQPTRYDPLAINYICFDWVRDILYLSSGWITTFLSIERCVCVIFPFTVKRIFTRSRCVVVVMGIYLVQVSLYMPVFVTQWLAWTPVEVDQHLELAPSDNDRGSRGNTTKTTTNTSTAIPEFDSVVRVDRLVAVFASSRPQVDAYVDYADGFPFISQFIVLVSVVWMTHGLRMSNKVRKTMSAAAKLNVGGDEKTSADGKSKQQKSSSGGDGGMSYKNNRLVKVVLFLAIILITCNTPRFVAAYARHVHSDVTFDGEQNQNLFVLLWTLAILFTVINTTVNIFVYLIINTSYRNQFRRMFGCSK